MKIQELALEAIRPSPHNPRVFRKDDPALAELGESIKAQGLIQPITVRPILDGHVEVFEIVAGERRWRASVRAGLETITAIVREDLTDEQALELIVTENLQREDLNPLEEAKGYEQLLRLPGHDVPAIAARLGRSVKYVYDRVKLLALTDEAQQLLWFGRITAGHAILLARLAPSEQERVIADYLFVDEKLLWDPSEGDASPASLTTDRDDEKAVSVRELQARIDEHVKFDAQTVDPMIHPVTAERLSAAREQAEKIVAITHEHYIPEDARDGQKVLGPRSWKRADGKGESWECDHAVTGVIVVGPGRGEAFKVCIATKKCLTHWKEEQREAEKRAKAREKGEEPARARQQVDPWEKKRQAEDAERKRWEKARPQLLEAIAAKVRKAATGTGGLLARLILERVADDAFEKPKVLDQVPVGKSAEDLVRRAGFLVLVDALFDWSAHEDFPKLAKQLGVDAKAIVDQVAPKEPVQTSARPKTKRKGRKAA